MQDFISPEHDESLSNAGMPIHPAKPSWSFLKKFTLIFFAVYFGLLMFDTVIGFELLPGFLSKIWDWYYAAWDVAIKWTSKHIFHLDYEITIKPNGSGDTTYNYVQIFLALVLSLLFSLVWNIARRRHGSYRRLEYWLRVGLRYYLGYTLLIYGFVKVIKLQFPSPSLNRLLTPYGDSSPMGLAWTFVGYSEGYNMFTGGAEVLAGLLLFWKRTTLIGSLIAMTVMLNVAAMNFAFDIPVKLFSVNLVLIAAYLAAWDWHRLRNMFLLNRPADAALLAMPRPKKWKKIVQVSVKCLAITYALYTTLFQSYQSRREYGDAAPKPPLYGIYNVNTVTRNADTVAPLTTDTTRWRQVVINYSGYASVKLMNDSILGMSMKLDTAIKTAVFKESRDTMRVYNFRYEIPVKDQLVFTGKFGSDTLVINTNRYDEKRFRLVSRGFHWINEYPYNR